MLVGEGWVPSGDVLERYVHDRLREWTIKKIPNTIHILPQPKAPRGV